MKKRCKTFLLLVLPVMLLFSTLTAMPVTGAATEYTSWDALQKAISESDKTEFTLTQDIIAPGSLTTPLQIRDKNVVLDLNGYTLSRNRSSAHGTGQVIVVHKGASLTVKDSSGNNSGKITGGWATYNGAGIYVYGTLIFEGGSITGNKSEDKGAGIFLNGGNATIKGGVIDNNTAKYGGGIYCGVNTTLTLAGGIIRNNTATENGGAFYICYGASLKKMENKPDASISCNKAGNKGAAIYSSKGGYVYIIGFTLFNNTAPGQTGYDYGSYGNSFYLEDTSSSSKFWLLPTKVRRDTIYTSWSQLKSDIESGTTKNVILSQDLVASGSDKEIIVSKTRTVTIDLNGFTLDRHMSKSVDRGGVLRVEAYSKLIVIDSSGNNSGKITGGNSVNGGGICNHGELVFKGGTITGNRASKDGGGILTRNYDGFNAKMEVTGGFLQNNSANYGGGIYVDDGCKAVIYKMTVAGNSAGTDGGGIYGHEKSTLEIKNCPVINNKAKYGGGIYFKMASAVITNCKVSGNSASGHVGGLFNNYYSDCVINDSEFSYNVSAEKAGAIMNNNNSALEINNTAILNNKAATDGGALYVSSNDYAVYMNGCTLKKNTAQWGAGIYVLGGSRAIVGKTEFSDNAASKNGGAVWVGNNDNSSCDLRTCKFRGNSASQNGGGVYVQGKGTVTLFSCDMKNQHADNGRGGAIFAGDLDRSLIGLTDVTITENNAKEGGAIYANKAVIGAKGLCTVKNNTNGNSGGGNYAVCNVLLSKDSYISNPGLYKGSEIYVTALGKTAAKEISEYQTRYIKIENSKNVSFNPEKTVDTPIIASLFSKGSIVVVICMAAAAMIACAVAVIIKRKKSTSGGADNDR